MYSVPVLKSWQFHDLFTYLFIFRLLNTDFKILSLQRLVYLQKCWKAFLALETFPLQNKILDNKHTQNPILNTERVYLS